jgi:chorismate mutase / prephenate dehydratase
VKDLDRWRGEIDAIDARILRLLSRRVKIAVKVARLKRSSGLPYRSRERERELLARLLQANPGPLDRWSISRVFRVVIRETLRAEENCALPPRQNKRGFQ